MRLQKEGKTPGPGFYNQQDTVALNPSGGNTSLVKASPKMSFGKAFDRFHVPSKLSLLTNAAMKEKSPGPGKYSPKTNFN